MKNSALVTRSLYVLYFVLLSAYAVFSYSLTDPNLVLTSWTPYWQFQQWMWQTFFSNSQLLTQTYLALVTGIFATYVLLLHSVRFTQKWSWRVMLPVLLCFLPLMISYNALSHDVFNYIFNARMVMVYHANPHQRVALEFPGDDWTRFMHNTHTTAPYGYGWTVLSLLPYVAGLGKFLLTWLSFRAFNVMSLVVLLGLYVWLGKQSDDQKSWAKNLWLLFLNPLVLIEIVSTMHNDFWMMTPAVMAILLVVNTTTKKKVNRKNFWLKVILSAALLGLSISIKLATVLLLPIWLVLIADQLKLLKLPVLQWVRNHWAELSVLCLFLPLLTDRSQQFHPWYLTWLLVWLPWVRWSWLRNSLIVLSISSLWRYAPWLWTGYFTDAVIWQQKLITWIPLGVWLVWEAARALIWKTPQKPVQ